MKFPIPTSHKIDSIRNQFFVLLALCLCLFGMFAPAALEAQGPEWTEKDLAKSVHRAEQTFQAGEMSRAYGLFAHLVSVANDRAFLHLRFGATCTYTAQRLEEAEEHLNWAAQLGILETEHANDWHFYMGRLNQLTYQFSAAHLHFTQALEDAPRKAMWLNEARVALDQCASQSMVPATLKKLNVFEELVSHSNDFFRLYDMPVEEGRLLSIPDELKSNEDLKRGHESCMHWLPGSRIAFYSSYGKTGQTGLDVYRVAVNGKGEYGNPEKLPVPINGDFDDCSPILYEDAENGTQHLFFSSSRPESMGGFDIFESIGNFTNEEVLVSHEHELRQLPFQINSSADEWLYWPNQEDETTWLTTNRNQDFETKEIWHFSGSGFSPKPVSIRIEIHPDLGHGTLYISAQEGTIPLVHTNIKGGDFIDIAIESGEEIELGWKGDNATSNEIFRLTAPDVSVPQIAMESAMIGILNSGDIGLVTEPSIWVEQPEFNWNLGSLSNFRNSDTWFELLKPDQIAALRDRNMESASIEKVLMASRDEDSKNPIEQNNVPEWILEAMNEIGLNVEKQGVPAPITNIRSNAVYIQNQMELFSCWEAPGSDNWDLQTALKRYGEPALALLSEDTRELAGSVEENLVIWTQWLNQIDSQFKTPKERSEDWEVLTAYVQAQIKAYEGASIQIDEMHRRIEAHLVYERWVTEALPMQVSDFNLGLSSLSLRNPQIADLLTLSARSSAADDNPENDWLKLQETIWNTLTDSIIEVQTLGVYTLPGMEQVQNWFLRSGGLLDEASQALNPKEKVSKGQRAVGLIWESYKAGADKRDVVIEESKMNPGDWWKTFGTDAVTNETNYDGLNMFSSNKSPILDQANRYQSELDKLRIESKSGHYDLATLSNAISIRSGIAEEMNHLFGKQDQATLVKTSQKKSGRNKSEKVNPRQENMNLLVENTSNDIAHEVEKPTGTYIANSENASNEDVKSSSNAAVTIQIGAFMNQPDFDPSIQRQIIHSEKLPNGLTRYYYGSYSNADEALEDLIFVRNSLPDAFIRFSSSTPSIKKRNESTNKDFEQKAKGSASKSENVVKASKPTPSAASVETTSQKQFRVKIASFGTNLEPVEVARLLRLGNELNLEVRRSAEKTTYYSEKFSKIEDAQTALKLCERKGFNLAELEIVY